MTANTWPDLTWPERQWRHTLAEDSTSETTQPTAPRYSPCFTKSNILVSFCTYIQQIKRCTTANSCFQYRQRRLDLGCNVGPSAISGRIPAALNSRGRIRSNRPNKPTLTFKHVKGLDCVHEIAFIKGYINDITPQETMAQPPFHGGPTQRTQTIGPVYLCCLGGCIGWALDSWSKGLRFNSRPGRYQVN